MRKSSGDRSRWPLALVGLVTVIVIPAAGGAVVALDAFTTPERGQWELRDRGSGQTRRVCLRDGRDLIQLRHRGLSCRQTAVERGNTSAVVQYNCGSRGYGRTSIRVENPRLVQVESSGIAGGAPFEVSIEARYMGQCR